LKNYEIKNFTKCQLINLEETEYEYSGSEDEELQINSNLERVPNYRSKIYINYSVFAIP
jgi:hypothetical protein